MWKNGTKGVWIDGIPMVKDSRRQFNDTTLIIKKAQTYDSGQYSCVLTGLKSLSLNYTLEVVRKYKGL